MRGTEVPISPDVLRWAIAESGFEPDRVAELIRVEPETLHEWLAGRAKPKLTQFRKLAEALRRPAAALLLERPPVDSLPQVEFRRPADSARSKLDPKEVRYLRDASHVQRTLKWVLTELNTGRFALPRFSADVDPASAAKRAVDSLGITPEHRKRWRDVYAARRGWKEALEQAGVLVFSFPMGSQGIRGFSLHDEYAPLIAVNTTWNPQAQVFSLLHECGHLLTQSNSACLEVGTGRLRRPSDPAERWCERFAAAALLPWSQVEVFMKRTFAWRTGQKVRDLDVARQIANQFKVSVKATVLRLIEERAATWELFEAIPRAVDAKEPAGPRRGRTRAQISEATYGERAPRLFIRAMNEDLLSRSEVMNFLRVSDDDLVNLQFGK